MALTLNDNTGHQVIHITGTTATAQSIFTNKRYIHLVVWDGATAAGHKVHILTGNGKPWFGYTIDMAGQSGNSMWIQIGRYITGMKIDDMDSGTLYIHYA